MLPSPRTPNPVSDLNEIVFKYRTKFKADFKRSLDCNRRFVAYYGSIVGSFLVGLSCLIISIWMRLFLTCYQLFCWGLEESSAQYSLSSDDPLHIVVSGPPLSGDTTRYVARLSELHGLRQLTEEDIVFQKAGKRCWNRSILKGHRDDEGWVLDLND